MNSVEIKVPQGINPFLLDAQLRAALPTITGTVFTDYDVTAYWNVDPVPDADAVQAAAICAAHDPTQKTTAQQQAATVSAAAAHVVTVLVPQMATLSAYFAGLNAQSADVVSGAANLKAYAALATLLASISAWITANN